MTGRALPEWRGATPDARIPPRVRLRVFEAHGGVCALTGRKIMTGDDWQVDHRIPLALGGEHAEGNLQPVLASAHREKTREDVGRKAKAARVRAKHLGLHKPRNPLPGGKHDKLKRTIGRGTVRRDDA